MALIIEDGTGVMGANAFITSSEFYNYVDNRGGSIDDYTSKQIEGAIVIASSDFISTNYCYKGEKLNADQGLSIPTTEVPINSDIKKATCEATLAQLNGNLFVDPNSASANGAIKATNKEVGTLKTSVEYVEGSNYTYKYNTRGIDMLLKNYVTGGGYAPASMLRY